MLSFGSPELVQYGLWRSHETIPFDSDPLKSQLLFTLENVIYTASSNNEHHDRT